MSFWDSIFGNASSKIVKMGDKLANKNTTQDGRAAAFETLKEIKTEESRFQMLRRFDYNNDKTILDAEEKESIEKELLETPDQSIPALKRYLAQSTQVSGPLRILNKLLSPSDFVAVLLELLNFRDMTFNKQGSEKNQKIIHHLKDFPSKEVVLKLIPLLDESDDDLFLDFLEIVVSVASAENHKEERTWSQEITKKVLDLLKEREQSSRVFNRVLDIASEKKWVVSEYQSFLSTGLGERYIINDKGQVSRK